MDSHNIQNGTIPQGTHCELCGMVAESATVDHHGITHYYCSHHSPESSHGDANHVHNHQHHGEHDDSHHSHHQNIFKQKFWISLLLSIPVVLYSTMIQEWLGFSMPEFPGSQWIPLLFGTIVFWYGGLVFIKSAIAEIRAKQPGMMTLISLAIVVAYTYSVINSLIGHGMDFFWDLSTLIVIMLLGHWLEMNSVAKAQGALQELAQLLPDTAEVVVDGSSHTVKVAELHKGDIIRIKPGSSVPADGQVIEGASLVNESMITGESRMVEKQVGDEVIGGTLNGDGSLLVQVTKTGSESTLAGIMKLVADAQSAKSPTQLLADKAAGWLFYIALAAGLLTLIGWSLFAQADLNFTFERVVTVFIIACPHALGLAIPLVTSISTSLAASNGLLIRDRKALELAKEVDYVLFDKTGTLTMGEQGVIDIWTAEKVDTDKLLATAAAIEVESEHAIGKAIVSHAQSLKLSLPKVKQFKALPGHGAQAIVEGSTISIGGPQLLASLKTKLSSELKEWSSQHGNQGKSVVYIISQKTILGAIALADTVRSESNQAIEYLQDKGIKVAMLTGDSQDVAVYVAQNLGIEEYFAEVLPRDKASTVKKLQDKGFTVAFVGDGVNDAPALTQADIGIAIGAGTDVAIESADIVLIKSNPMDVVKVFALSKVTYAKMKQNLFWGAGYNLASIPLAAGALAPIGFILPPAIGAVIMSLSTIIVAANAQLLRKTDLT